MTHVTASLAQRHILAYIAVLTTMDLGLSHATGSVITGVCRYGELKESVAVAVAG